MPRINLLPWREAERKRKRQEFFLSFGAALATAALVTLLGHWQMSASIQHQRDRNNFLTQEIAGLDKQIEEINGLDAQKSRLLARMEIIETLQRSRPEIVHVFDELVHLLPDGVYLTYLRQTGTRFELRGVAQSSTRVSSFMRKIDASEWLADPTLQIVQTRNAGTSGGSEFTLFANQRQRTTTADDLDAAGGPAAQGAVK
ncbi:MAG: PilN domain-containing protein [Steroidobacteraceae bacterium]